MSDYQATPIDVIAQCLLSISGGAPVIAGRGFSSVVRTAGGAAAGDFTLTLDPGLPGGGAVDSSNARCEVTVRGGSGAPPVTTLTQKAVSYPTPTTLRVIVSVAGTGTDPTGADAGGLEIVLSRVPVSTFQVQMVGPLFP